MKKRIVKALPVVTSVVLGIGIGILFQQRELIEDKLADRLTARQIIKENIPLQ